MIFKLAVLFLTPLISGLAIYLFPQGKSAQAKPLLIFAGAYLFSITIIHLLPELFHEEVGAQWIGLMVLAGFFLQQVLEYFSAGVEHGHVHLNKNGIGTSGQLSAYMLLLALCIHAFLEGGLLAEHDGVGHYDANAILMGIALHRAPAALALMSVLTHQLKNTRKAIPFLVAFSLAAPLGLMVTSALTASDVLSVEGIILLYALVSGNFLHISTTIVYESSPSHKFNAKNLLLSLAGAGAAVAVEFFIG